MPITTTTRAMAKKNAKIGDSVAKAIMKTYPSRNTITKVKIASMALSRSVICAISPFGTIDVC
jgi:hypothetical protein